MASLPAYKVNDFIKNFAASKSKSPYRLWLLYGPEVGLSAERQEVIINHLAPDKDPFRFVQLPQSAIVDNVGRFFDEMLALSFDGGKRLVVITAVDERLYELALADFLKNPSGDNDLLLVAGNLDKRSQLRAMVEKVDFAIALPAYQDDEKTIAALLQEQLRLYKATMAPDAERWLCQTLGGNRLETRRTIEQLCLYGMGGPPLTLDVVRPFVNVSHETVDKFINAVLSKNVGAVIELQDKLRLEKIEPIQLIRRMMIELSRLQQIHDEWAAGGNLDSIIERAVPFFKNRPIFARAVKLFRRDKLSFWRGKLLGLEDETKSSLPAQLLTERFFLQMSKSPY